MIIFVGSMCFSRLRSATTLMPQSCRWFSARTGETGSINVKRPCQSQTHNPAPNLSMLSQIAHWSCSQGKAIWRSRLFLSSPPLSPRTTFIRQDCASFNYLYVLCLLSRLLRNKYFYLFSLEQKSIINWFISFAYILLCFD